MKPAYLLSIIISVLAAMMLPACSNKESHTTGKPVVTVSLRPQQYLLEEIVGDAYSVRSLLPKGGDPESYDPSLADMAETQNSAAYLTMGNFAFEDALTAKLRQANPRLPIVNTSKGIRPITGTHGQGHADPHVWVSVKNALIIAANMRDAMTAIDPDNAPLFARNYEHLAKRLERLHSKIKTALAPHRGEAFLVWHPSLSYFARDYGLKQIAVGGQEHKESSIPEMRERIDKAAQSGAKVFFVQEDVDSRHAEALSDMVKARMVEINPLSYSWLAQMSKIYSALADDNE